jgi:hypothetical protein
MNLDEKVAALRTEMQAANMVLQDLGNAIKEARALVAELKTAANVAADEEIAKAVKEGLDKFGKELETAIDNSTQKVFERFDQIRDTLLGETRSEAKRGDPSLPELADAVGTLNRAQRRKMGKR